MTDPEFNWGWPGPADPAERAWAHNIDFHSQPLRLERLHWSQEGVLDLNEQRAAADEPFGRDEAG